VTIGKHTLLANTLWAAWGEMRMEVSDDGFASIFQELPMMDRGWLRGHANKPQETPPPPLVPYLADDWPFEHYGFPAFEVLDEDSVVVVFGRTQWGTPSYHEFDPPEWDNFPVEKEKIQAIFYRRQKGRRTELSPGPESLRIGAPARANQPRGRWVLAERITVANLGGPMAQLPDGDLIAKVGSGIRRSAHGGRTWQKIPDSELPEKLVALGILKSGRWLAVTMKLNQQWRGGGEINVGTEGGYPVRESRKDQSYDAEIVVHYSDDEGRNWQAVQGPLQVGDPIGQSISSKGPVAPWPCPSLDASPMKRCVPTPRPMVSSARRTAV